MDIPLEEEDSSDEEYHPDEEEEDETAEEVRPNYFFYIESMSKLIDSRCIKLRRCVCFRHFWKVIWRVQHHHHAALD